MSSATFHLAFPVTSLADTLDFYTRILGCEVGRRSDRWIDFDFHGHQITAHLVANMPIDATNEVDGKSVPVRHFGLILQWQEWLRVRDNLLSQDIDFLIEPHIRFKSEPAEQATLFITDPNGNGLEFKAFRNPEAIFSH